MEPADTGDLKFNFAPALDVRQDYLHRLPIQLQSLLIVRLLEDGSHASTGWLCTAFQRRLIGSGIGLFSKLFDPRVSEQLL
jgi:hypothetical protein